MQSDIATLDCPFDHIEGDEYLCPQCGYVYHGPEAPRRNCPKAPKTIEARKAFMLNHLAKKSAGCKNNRCGIERYRTPEEIEANLDACYACPDNKFTGTGCRLYKGCDGQKIWVLSHRRRNRGCKNKHWGPSLVATATT